jgi:hypothetical protein
MAVHENACLDFRGLVAVHDPDYLEDRSVGSKVYQDVGTGSDGGRLLGVVVEKLLLHHDLENHYYLCLFRVPLCLLHVTKLGDGKSRAILQISSKDKKFILISLLLHIPAAGRHDAQRANLTRSSRSRPHMTSPHVASFSGVTFNLT